jgi:hypothetical protein
MGQIRKEPNSHWRIAKELVGGGRAPPTKLKKGGLDLDYQESAKEFNKNFQDN